MQVGQEFFLLLRTLNKGNNLSTCTVWLMGTVGSCLQAGWQKPTDVLSPEPKEASKGRVGKELRRVDSEEKWGWGSERGLVGVGGLPVQGEVAKRQEEDQQVTCLCPLSIFHIALYLVLIVH